MYPSRAINWHVRIENGLCSSSSSFDGNKMLKWFVVGRSAYAIPVRKVEMDVPILSWLSISQYKMSKSLTGTNEVVEIFIDLRLAFIFQVFDANSELLIVHAVSFLYKFIHKMNKCVHVVSLHGKIQVPAVLTT